MHHSFDHGHGQLATMKWPVQTATSFDDKVLLAADFMNANSLLSCMIEIYSSVINAFKNFKSDNDQDQERVKIKKSYQIFNWEWTFKY